MKNNPLVLSILIGIILVLAIISVSFFVKMKSLMDLTQEEKIMRMNSQKMVEDLQAENTALKESNEKLEKGMGQLTAQVEKFKKDIAILEDVKADMEEMVKEESSKRQVLEKELKDKATKVQDKESAAKTQEAKNAQPQPVAEKKG